MIMYHFVSKLKALLVNFLVVPLASGVRPYLIFCSILIEYNLNYTCAVNRINMVALLS